MKQTSWRRLLFGSGLASFVLALGLTEGCGQSGAENAATDGAAGTDGAEDGGVLLREMDAPDFARTFDTGVSDSAAPTCEKGCPSGLQCVNDRCLPPQSVCSKSGTNAPSTSGACAFDTYCDTASGRCLPYGTGGRTQDPSCRQVVVPGNFSPKTKCAFPSRTLTAQDGFPDHVDVQATPMVARLDGKDSPPSMVVPFTAPVTNGYTENRGVLRILRGDDCTQQVPPLGGNDIDGDGVVDWVRSSSSVALGDLDGDGRPEIVVQMVDTNAIESLVAFTKKAQSWQPLWPKVKATSADGTKVFDATVDANAWSVTSWSGPSLHDLDNDGKPEVLRDGYTFDGQTGRLKAPLPTGYKTRTLGITPVVADLDDDPRIEMTNGARVWEFDEGTKTWVQESYFQVTLPEKPGWVAVADFDPYDTKKIPEIVVVEGGKVSIYRTNHSVFMGMVLDVPGGGGGPPTVADFDGDGLPEVALAGGKNYTVFDPDCQAVGRPGGRCDDRTHCYKGAGTTCVEKILWSRGTQDVTSNVTGSSIFDFEGDGKAEVVYADECFGRVYSGVDGRVIFSRYRSSCTWLEHPIVVDVDGDFRAEMVIPSNTACGPIGVGFNCSLNMDPDGVDSQFPGLVCQTGSDCVSGICDAGLCRCTTSADCCSDKNSVKCEEFGTKCANPPAGTSGSGKTCRANHPHGVQGIRVYEDQADRWVRSRTLWNQYAYAVTHVNEDGTIPKTSEWKKNWTDPSLNNFRQNVPGTIDGKALGDLTAQVSTAFECQGTSTLLRAPVCNRGTAPVGSGIVVGFYLQGQRLCSGTTTGALEVGNCENVSCLWPSISTTPVDISVVPNDDQAVAQCDSSNDKGVVVGVACVPPK